MDKVSLRRAMRKKRRALSPVQQRLASHSVARRMGGSSTVRFQKRWALYLSNDGEISPAIWQKQLAHRGLDIFLPVLHPIYHNRLWFLKLSPDTRLRKNKYGIYEPDLRSTERTPAWSLSVVCFPLVAFDQTGNRLGMGGGYYDRTFAPRRTTIKRPKLVGMAHDFQRVDKIPHEPWDIPLSGIATDRKFYQINSRQNK